MKTLIRPLFVGVAVVGLAVHAQQTPTAEQLPPPAVVEPAIPAAGPLLAQASNAPPAVAPAPAPVPPSVAPADAPVLPSVAPAPAPVPPSVAPAPASEPEAAPAESPNVAVTSSVVAPANGTIIRTNVVSEVVPLIVIDDVPLIDAVKNLARQASLNFQFDPRVTTMSNQPNVTIRFENVTAEDALSAVLENYNLAILHDPKTKISRITVKDPKAEEPLFSHVIQLKYSAPTNLVPILKATLSPRSQVLGDPRTSQLIVVTTEKEFPSVEKLVAKLDTPTRQVLIEAQFWETDKSLNSVKGVDWSGTLGENAQRITFGNGNTIGNVLQSSRDDRTVTTPGSPMQTPNGRPIPRPRDVSTLSQNSTRSLYETTVGNGGLSMNTAQGFHPATAFLNAKGLDVVLNFLNNDSDTELVSTPRAVTLDNQIATLSVTKALPIFKITPGSANSPAGAEITYTNVGTILQVTPRIAVDNNISLHIVPEVSDRDDIQDRQIINGVANEANIYAISRVEAHVMVPSGSTLVMGGLVRGKYTKGYSKVPVLGDAPGLGLLFRKDTKKYAKRNLMIFVTPTVISDGDFQLAENSTDFLKTNKPKKGEPNLSAWDTGKPFDWGKLRKGSDQQSNGSTSSSSSQSSSSAGAK